MSIIPFGLVGTIYGHYVWDVPLSMFSVVGLLGMTGIIINDSIVLVTTIDEYAEKRGLFPAIIDATADRLRPVLLTTLTTVLGLLPLLFETSRQALFLKPTVITLCYGLGFGVFMVLLVVPSLVVVQKDFGRFMDTFKRGLWGDKLPAKFRGVFVGASIASAILVLASSGYLAVTRTVAPWIGGVLSNGLVQSSPIMATLIVVIIGALAIMLISAAVFYFLSKSEKST
jgi:predicted RND superfamily exporter protein